MIERGGPVQKAAKGDGKNPPERAAAPLELRVSAVERIGQVDKAEWDACANPQPASCS